MEWPPHEIWPRISNSSVFKRTSTCLAMSSLTLSPRWYLEPLFCLSRAGAGLLPGARLLLFLGGLRRAFPVCSPSAVAEGSPSRAGFSSSSSFGALVLLRSAGSRAPGVGSEERRARSSCATAGFSTPSRVSSGRGRTGPGSAIGPGSAHCEARSLGNGSIC
eukprot:scaffold3540_cov379-Prasinococcus_capsulatus_cf.AAC.5